MDRSESLQKEDSLHMVSRTVIESFTGQFKSQKAMAEKAVMQLSEEQLHQPLDENTNSLVLIMKHVAGNLRSRFTDFLTSDSEKPDRDRDSEFVDDIADRKVLMDLWERGWNCLFDALSALSDADIERTITIRQQPHTVVDALTRSLGHTSYHVGQIVQLSRYLAKENWSTITIPRGASSQFNEKMRQKFGK
jgi:hypothetical protein